MPLLGAVDSQGLSFSVDALHCITAKFCVPSSHFRVPSPYLQVSCAHILFSFNYSSFDMIQLIML